MRRREAIFRLQDGVMFQSEYWWHWWPLPADDGLERLSHVHGQTPEDDHLSEQDCVHVVVEDGEHSNVKHLVARLGGALEIGVDNGIASQHIPRERESRGRLLVWGSIR